MSKIDQADWHGKADDELDPEAYGTHIGMYVAWAISRGLESEDLRSTCGEAVESVRQRQMTGMRFLWDYLGGKFLEDELEPIALEFTRKYYMKNKKYFDDYDGSLCDGLPSMYHVEDTWENFDRIAPVIDDAFATWRAKKSKKKGLLGRLFGT